MPSGQPTTYLPDAATLPFDLRASVGHATCDDRQSLVAADDDALLVDAIQGKDREAFTAFVSRQQGFVFGYLRSRMLEPSDAEDLCQEVFLRCFVGKVRFPENVPVRPWLLGVARNVLREHVRKVNRRKEVAWTELCLEIDALADNNHDDYAAVQSFLKQCLDSLGKSARDALDMHYYAQMKMSAIGAKLRRSEGAVKLLVFRARQALKNCITRKIHASADD
ncbi:sigma-70 family RNA polymerase sigma factor [Blastopirellula sp. J2-11]|uniref:RNA polymerase sigma factor n=1 Tax=Blastopirellula sp. J2-11 TaxID=2943192 RepID=UPI0021C5D079|nr:sigma-70 family RNA polymerase sigma factor [Blastopirellula sp. J2-11]UUO05430.1 sigma-70 family RNA polymerase sigma factor [Blastopirellula sp. J2-11]